MSSDAIITVQGLSKRYVIGHESRHDNLRDTLHHTARKLWRRFRWGTGFRTEEFWALKDVSFEVKRGEVVGIIGRNGAGKSTLLKILSRITEPTEGTVTIKGRVASLLEVGTGFHPELSGRENVFLNGAILGMSRAEIRRKFDEIVAFAEVEKFLDTPVKHYSSGMYVRLAFAVAAHLEPEILIVDEVLAVGDAHFQKKCLGKMQEVSTRDGRTVLFVSHNTEAICALCSQCLLLREGRLVTSGETMAVVSQYLGADQPIAAGVTFGPTNAAAHFRFARVRDAAGRTEGFIDMASPITVTAEFAVRSHLAGLEVALAVLNFKGERLFYSSNADAVPWISVEAAGTYRVSATIPAHLLLPGRYHVNLALHRPNAMLFDLREQALSFEVIKTAADHHGFPSSSLGVVNVDVAWRQEPAT